MPRNTRNFWIELSVDGTKTDVATGPRSADGGFEMVIKQRDAGDIIRALAITGYCSADGTLTLEVARGDFADITVRTKR